MSKKLLLVIPPLLQFNCPYPSTAYLTQYLKKHHFDVEQVDWSLALILKVFSKLGLEQIFMELKKTTSKPNAVKIFLKKQEQYLAVVELVISFLQGDSKKNIVSKINQRNFLPEGNRFQYLNQHQKMLYEIFEKNENSDLDIAKYLATLFIDDISDMISTYIDPFWGLARYGEKLAQSITSLNPMLKRLKIETVIDELYLEIIHQDLKKIKPAIMGFSVPFPGNVYGALKGAIAAKKINSHMITIMGGGFVNTELKFLSDKRFFSMIDYLTFDDGEKPLHLLMDKICYDDKKELLRTWSFDKKNKTILKSPSIDLADIAFKNLEGPSYQGLDFAKYISMIEYPNPMMRYWTDYKWNKIILAHGCYWKKCTFCDISLDYIKRFEPANAKKLVDQMQRISQETKNFGFHLVDEAAPPSVMKAMSEEILKRKFTCEWWGNIRFDEAFTLDTTKKLAEAGLTAVSGGLEVASERVLKLIAKGVSIEQVARVTHNFRTANILVHAYLMYGFPTQTVQETIDSLEVVRQLFLNECLSSAYWHRFSVTAHSPVGLNPRDYQVQLRKIAIPKNGIFAKNDLAYDEIYNKTQHDKLGSGLKKALYNYQLGIGFDLPLQDWFDFSVPSTTLSKNYIVKIIKASRK